MNARLPCIATNDLHRYQRKQDAREARDAKIDARADELYDELHEWAKERGFSERSKGMRLLSEEMARAEFGV